MPKFSEKKILPHKPKQIFDLVMDIEKYPEFLPWCKQARIVKIISPQNLEADLLIGFKGFLEKYRSDVKFFLDENNVFTIQTKAIEGPFKQLFSEWKIKSHENNSCEIEFFIDFSFNSFLLEKMIGVIFEKATQKMVKVFEERAFELFKNENL